MRKLLALLLGLALPAYAQTVTVPAPNLWAGQINQQAPAGPTGTTNTGGLMMGLGAAASPCTFTPRNSTRVFFAIQGYGFNSVALSGWFVNGRIGTGTAPANAAAGVGTVVTATEQAVSSSASQTTTFNVSGIATGLTLGTQIWGDAFVGAITSGTATIGNISCYFFEIP